MQTSLYEKIKPNLLEDIVGQEHLINILKKMIAKGKVLSMILYGSPGCGKTSIARALTNELKLPHSFFNAATQNKKALDDILANAKYFPEYFLIIDEIHRMNKDKQDILLPHIESGLVTLIGMTTANPFKQINPAIRSRTQLFKVNQLTNKDIITVLNKALTKELNNDYNVDNDALTLIADCSSGDLRFAINALELCTVVSDNNYINVDLVKENISIAASEFDKNQSGYYDHLSALQKSIRGSDVNASLYYLARILQTDDLISLERRITVIAYEDIGLANPELCARTVLAFQAANNVGLPEAALIITPIIIELALSPKSRSACDAFHNVSNLTSQKDYSIPNYLQLTPIGLQNDEKYNYSRPELWPYIQYLPKSISNHKFYTPWLTSIYEKELANNYAKLLSQPRTDNLKMLNNAKSNKKPVK